MKQAEIDFFDRMAPDWDSHEVNSTPVKVREILSLLPWCRGMRVLDLGTGTGVLVPYLVEKGCRVLGIDASEGMLGCAVEKFGRLPGVEFLRSDFEASPVEGRFDRVMLYSVYPHLHHPGQTLQRLLRDNVAGGGDIVIAFPSDENFVNGIHRRRKAESDLLPPAGVLARRIGGWGMRAEVLADTPRAYVVRISNI